jgi:SnoaL-like domain
MTGEAHDAISSDRHSLVSAPDRACFAFVCDAPSPLAVLERMVQAFCTGDTSTVSEFVSVDYLDHQGLGGEAIYGADGFARVVMAARSGYRTLALSIISSDTGAESVEGHLVWTGERSDGVQVCRETIETLRVEDGKAVEHWGQRL